MIWLKIRAGHNTGTKTWLSGWQRPGAQALWLRLYSLQPSGAGIDLGSVLFLGQFGLGRGDLLLGLCQRGGGAADLRDEFLKGGAIHCVPSSRHAATPKIA